MTPVKSTLPLVFALIAASVSACRAGEHPVSVATVDGVTLETRAEVSDDQIVLHYRVSNRRDVDLFVFVYSHPLPDCKTVSAPTRAFTDFAGDRLTLRLAIPQPPADIEMAEVPFPRAVQLAAHATLEGKVEAPLPAVVDDPVRRAIAASVGLGADQVTRAAHAAMVTFELGVAAVEPGLSAKAICPGMLEIWPPGLASERQEVLLTEQRLLRPIAVRTFP